MSHLVSRNTRPIGDVMVDASLRASLRVICSGSIAHSRIFYTTHSFTNSSNLVCIVIVAPLGKFKQALSKFREALSNLSKFEQVYANTFEAVGGAL